MLVLLLARILVVVHVACVLAVLHVLLLVYLLVVVHVLPIVYILSVLHVLLLVCASGRTCTSTCILATIYYYYKHMYYN